MRPVWNILVIAGIAAAACPYMDGEPALKGRAEGTTESFLDQFTVDDSDSYLTSDAGGRFSDDHSLKAGERGPTLLEDFIFRQKIQHFDHERVSFHPTNCHCYILTCSRYLSGLFTLEEQVATFT
jgi:catalase